MSLTLSQLLGLQREFDLAHAGRLPFFVEIGEENIGELEHLIVCILGELGEFSNIVKKVRRGDMSLADAKGALDEELVDVFIYLLKMAGQFNVDLESGFLDKMKRNTVRFEKYRI
ncbi:MazG nucleotide pyrophosphohydrolase domain-containing protein [Burkholderia stagnalis]|uniref:MazG nucleotide pyrophosphohydrolase domain-containing protein n=1 Tax=Burkholderia stagnalis TaxID=1503054 RepID=UPI00075F1CAA|nr:MazG nucleotide pyrophosphohydrolase domain-containing protein [Burkholderia stagnalis]KVX71386.1 nucleotide pyrophosphohydrolase [Burkholderia stagnalis]